MDMKFYPPRLWGLDYLFNTPIKLNIDDIHHLSNYPKHPGAYCLLNHPVSKVCIIGDVRTIETREKFISYCVDDGSGSIKCTVWRQKDQHNLGILPGELVRVLGTISEFNGRRTLQVTSINKEADPSTEVFHWLEMIKLKQTVYNEPFVLPPSFYQEQNDISKLVRDKLLQFLNETDIETFQLNQLGEYISDESSNVDSFKEELHKIVMTLVSEGYLVHTKRDGYYKFISDESISRVIIDIFNKCKDFSLSFDYICKELKNINELQNLTAERTEHILTKLIDQNLIYPAHDKMYRLT